MVPTDQILSTIGKIRSSGAIGRSELSLRLFDYLVNCALKNTVPKELEVALDVFGKKIDFDAGTDAIVRVYIFKLRRKLEEYYAGPGKDDELRLVFPRGDYRVLFEYRAALPEEVLPNDDEREVSQLEEEAEAELESIVAHAAANHSAHRWTPWIWALATTLCINVFVLGATWWPGKTASDAVWVASRPIWASMLDDDLPIYIVVGDYFIFAEMDDTSMAVKRLVREFDINSRIDLERYLKNNPELAGKYMDIALQYLPISTAATIKNLMSVLDAGGKPASQIRVVTASELTPAMVRSAHIVYVGLISGMGILTELVFRTSRFAIGESYDELIDLETKEQYVSQAGVSESSHGPYTDYGYLATRISVDKNSMVILAGMSDVGLSQLGEVVTQSSSLDLLTSKAGSEQNLEALYSVKALERSNVYGSLISVSEYPIRLVEVPENGSDKNKP